MKILIINGPNINLLGRRESDFYGNLTIRSICEVLIKKYIKLRTSLFVFQSNSEYEIIEIIQESFGEISGLIINPGGYTHTSVSMRDALSVLKIPIIEVHISNIDSRESFRKKSIFSTIVNGQISGFSFFGYILAVRYIMKILISESDACLS